MKFPEHLHYTKEHEWIKIEGGEAVIGITEYAQRELGDIVYLDVETVGQELKAENVFGTVEAVKTVSDLYMPVDGTITSLNPKLSKNPELVNTDPYGEGWIIKLKLSGSADVQSLMDAKAYETLVG